MSGRKREAACVEIGAIRRLALLYGRFAKRHITFINPPRSRLEIDRDPSLPVEFSTSPGTRGRSYAEGYLDRRGCALVGNRHLAGSEDLGDGRFPTRFDHDAVVVIRTVDYSLSGAWPTVGERQLRVVRPPTGRDRHCFARARLIGARALVVGLCMCAEKCQNEDEAACRVQCMSLHARHSPTDVFDRWTLAQSIARCLGRTGGLSSGMALLSSPPQPGHSHRLAPNRRA